MSDNDDNQDEGRGQQRPWGNHGFRQRMEHSQRIQFGRRGFLRPQMIELLEKQPMNGAEIMDKLQEKSHGWYRPSPGSIYPLLEQLEREGLIAKNKDGKFELTPEYVAQSGKGDEVMNALTVLESNVSYLEDLSRASGAKLSKSKDRIEKLAKRLGALSSALQSGTGA